MNASDIIDDLLISNGYDGLYDENGCRCLIGEKCGNCLLCIPLKKDTEQK